MNLIHNLSSFDKRIRVLLGISFEIIAVLIPFSFWLKIIFLTISIYGIGTSATGVCPIYKIFGISTCSQ
ncbi:MAG: DUF2892 domain-containing protein [Candidatus Marinimicrobia bacterium]|nr:DUF2892 domain-containing protein [Candidatus Neomarinimicrobiota bacterium]